MSELHMQRLELLRKNIQTCFLGNRQAIDRVIICLLARGHVLIEDVPGVGKTTLATTLAKSLDCSVSRIQLTPDMLPADVLGVTVWDQNKSEFIFKPGPIFSNIVLADEINRTTPRTQSAMLEAMNESQVSMDGKTHRLLQPFIVLATQNPFEFEGTYFLPESQLDRFLMRLNLGYPSPDDEARILTLDPSRKISHDIEPVMTTRDLIELQQQTDEVNVDPSLVDYIVQIASATRTHEQVQTGVSPRGSLALMRASRATALLNGRDYAIPDDIIQNVVPVFAHRITTRSFAHDGDTTANARIMTQILETVASPV